jgi:RNA polymerase sigma-70 factor (ECF subfamily)
MNTDEVRQSLSSISTLWTVVCQAHHGSAEAISSAQGELLQCYGRAIHRYLLGALRDAEAADELGQEFALRFIRGDFRTADPERGRFRDFVKGVLSHMIADYYRKRNRPSTSTADAPEPTAPDPGLDQQFLKSWRDELMQLAWRALEEEQARTGKPFHTVLRFRAQHPKLHSPELAEQLSAQFGKKVTAAWVRQTLHRAREKFMDVLVQAVLATMADPTLNDLENELGELGLLTYCKSAVAKLQEKK